MKKRIICLILCIISLVPMFALMSSAETEDVVFNDLKKISIEGKPFNEADYPLDPSNNGIYLLTMGFGLLNDAKTYCKGVYFYYYNPSGHKLVNGTDGKFYFAKSSDRVVEDYKTYGGTSDYLCTVECSEDNRFVRCSLNISVSVGECYFYAYPKDFFDVETGQSVISLNSRSFNVNISADSGVVSATDGGLMELDLDLYGTVWRDENFVSLDRPYEYQELATVYFTIPQDVYDTYDQIWSVSTDFYMFKSTPIIVTNSATINSMPDISVLNSGYEVKSYFDKVPTLSYGKLQYWNDSNNAAVYTAPEWIYNPANNDRYNYEDSYPDRFGDEGYWVFPDVCNRICYYFYDSNIKIDPDDNSFYQVVPANGLTAYVDQYSQFYYPDSYTSFVCGVAPELYESASRYLLDFKRDDIYNMDTTVDVPDGERKWWEILFNLNRWQEVTETVNKLLVIEKPAEVAAQYANDLAGLSETYKIGIADAPNFLSYLQNAEGVVTLVRFANNQYECRELEAKTYSHSVLGTDYYDKIEDGTTWLSRAYFYQDVDVTKVTFERDGTLYEYKVVSDPIDIDGGVGVKNDANVKPGLTLDSIRDAIDRIKDIIKDGFDKIKTVFGIIGIVLVVGLAILLISKIFRRRQKVKIEFTPPSDNKRRRK